MNCSSPSLDGAADKRSERQFAELSEPFRRELKVHSYRMLGSVHEAEDAVQESYLRAWRSFATLDHHQAMRAWLYRIATNVCLDMIASRKNRQRLLPDQWSPSTDEMPNGVAAPDVAWLEPFPDADLGEPADDQQNPERLYASREAVQLAFVAAIQQLPPRQRAVLLLCEVLGWSAIETATLLGGTAASINSALQRARSSLAKLYPAGRPEIVSPPTPAQQRLLDRYMRAWEQLDLEAFVGLLKEDARYTMPPLPQWYAGPAAIGRFFAWAWKNYDGYRLVPIGANRQPAFAAYSRVTKGARWEMHSIHLVELEGDAISALTLFVRPESTGVFDLFGLAHSLEASHPGS